MDNTGVNITRSSRPFAGPTGGFKSSTDIGDIRSFAGDDVDTRKDKLRRAAEGFEAIFARIMLKGMRTSMTEGDMFGSGISGEIFGDMMDGAIADRMASRSALGLADAMYRQLVKSIDNGEVG